jgi:hypothetical protein
LKIEGTPVSSEDWTSLDTGVPSGYIQLWQYKPLGFDLDGTLYPAWKMYGASAGLAFRYGTFLRAFAKARKILRDPG